MPKTKSDATASEKVNALEIHPVHTLTMPVAILGKRPIILNRLSEKARRELLAPAGRKTSAQRQGSLKHDPYGEFRSAPYLLKDPDQPTYLAVMSSSFKAAMATAALDIPGARKAQIGRLVWVEDHYTPLYGIPTLSMAPVRSSDINRTPDIRTRAMVESWACIVRVTFVETLIKQQAIINLLTAAGLTVGVGDWRNEKGKGIYGQFEVVDPSDSRHLAIMQSGGREAQIEAMAEPQTADEESEELLRWWFTEVKRRGFALPGEVDEEGPGEDDDDDDEGVEPGLDRDRETWERTMPTLHSTKTRVKRVSK